MANPTSAALTCWKEIANYLGKGVRTVQRYERDAGLPVKRPSQRDKGVVFAWPEELDSWISKQFGDTAGSSEVELLQLRDEITRLEAENEVLRHELQLLTAKKNAGNGSSDEVSTEAIWHRCALLLSMNKLRRRECSELTNAARTLRLLREHQAPLSERDAGKPPQPSKRTEVA